LKKRTSCATTSQSFGFLKHAEKATTGQAHGGSCEKEVKAHGFGIIPSKHQLSKGEIQEVKDVARPFKTCRGKRKNGSSGHPKNGGGNAEEEISLKISNITDRLGGNKRKAQHPSKRAILRGPPGRASINL